MTTKGAAARQDSRSAFTAWIRSDSFKASHSDEQAPGLQAPNAIEQHTLIEVLES